MDAVWHVQAEDAIGNTSYSRYYTSSSWAERKVFQLRRDQRNVRVGLRVLRGVWEEIHV